MRFDLPGDQIACHDATRLPVDDDQIEHLGPGEHLDLSRCDLTQERLIRSEQKLLSRLAAGVKRTRYLCATERTVREQAAVLPRERHALRDALVDDVDADLCQPVNVRFA